MINLQIQKLIEWGLDDFVVITNPQYDQLIKDVTSSIQGISIDYVMQMNQKESPMLCKQKIKSVKMRLLFVY